VRVTSGGNGFWYYLDRCEWLIQSLRFAPFLETVVSKSMDVCKIARCRRLRCRNSEDGTCYGNRGSEMECDGQVRVL
jgi:hypothetical protein